MRKNCEYVNKNLSYFKPKNRPTKFIRIKNKELKHKKPVYKLLDLENGN